MTISKNPLVFRISLISGLLVLWALVYSVLKRFSEYLTYSAFHLASGTHIGDALAFFLYETPKVIMLLTLIVFGIGVVRSFFTPEKTRAMLAGKKTFVGNILAALLGVVTPFCSCSAVPLFIGFVQAGVPLGVTFSFLISAPMINEIALVLLFGLFGWKVAALYLGTGLAIALVAGIVIGKLRMEKHVEGWVYDMRMNGGAQASQKLTWTDRIDYGRQAVKDIVVKVWPYIVAGILVGAAIHGWVPAGLMAKIMGAHAWWSVPLAVAIGIPMYSNAAGIIPIVEALLSKGAALGTVLAFMMSVIGLSLPEMVILRKVLKPTLIAVFIAVVGVGILCVGFLFNLVL
ncbi:MAG: permease [Chitinivibrionales bacterium]|nr:permease [Chitinivibrionales bacterium]